MTDADKAFGQYVQKEAAQELRRCQCHLTLPAAAGIILPAESDTFLIEGQQAVIGNGHAMGVDHPVVAMETTEQFCELSRVSERRNRACTLELLTAVDVLQAGEELAAKPAENRAIQWQEVEAEPPGFVVLYRYRKSLQIEATFERNFSKRLDPQPGMKVLYARTSIQSDRDQIKKLAIGCSDEVSVFLNGSILYRGRAAQGFREPGFLGIMSPEDDAVYLPLKKGTNELILAVSEIGGGWGFICRPTDIRQ